MAAATDHATAPATRAALVRAGDAAVWRRLQTDLRARLAAGEFADRFPGELSLAVEYAVSRHTVREALRGLRLEGLVSAARGRAPQALAAPAPGPMPPAAARPWTASGELDAQIQQTRVLRLERQADGVIAERLGLEESTPLIYLERLLLAGGEPLALDRVWLPEAIAGPLLGADLARDGLYQLLHQRCGVTVDGGHELVRAHTLSTAERSTLAAPDHAALAIRRLGLAGGVAVEIRHLLARGDRFTLRLELPSAARAHAAD